MNYDSENNIRHLLVYICIFLFYNHLYNRILNIPWPPVTLWSLAISRKDFGASFKTSATTNVGKPGALDIWL